MMGRLLLVCCAAASALSWACPGAAMAAPGRTYVIRPLPAEQLRRLVGVPAQALPVGVRFDGAQVEKDAILVRFMGSEGPLRIRLEHPNLQSGGPATRRFSLRFDDPGSAASPHGQAVLRALSSHLRANEGGFRWTFIPPPSHSPSYERFRLRDWIPPLYLAWVVLLLVFGPWLNLRRHRGAPAVSHTSWRLDHWDVAALGVMVFFAASVALPMLRLPLLCDEATNLEPRFWTEWYWCSESAAHPPLFRLLIHIFANVSESRWVIRAPSLLFAMVAIWLLYRLARERSSGPAAVAVAAMLSLSATFWQWALVQKSLTLWLCLLLAAYGELARALGGERRRLALFSLWATLACLTHYLSVVYLGALCVYACWRHREAWRDYALALLPAALATAPLAAPLFLTSLQRGDPSNEVSLARLLLFQAVLNTGLFYLGIASLAVLLNRREGIRQSALAWMGLTGFGVTLLLGVIAPPVWSRYFYPVLPLGLLWLVSRLRWRRDRVRLAQMALVILAGSALVRQGVEAASWVYGRALVPQLHDRYLAHLSRRGSPPPPQVVLVFPSCAVAVIAHELTGSRLAPPSRPEDRNVIPVERLGGRWWVALPGETPPEKLERLLASLGAFDVIWRERFGRVDANPAGRWVLGRCRALLPEGPRGSGDPGVVLRCQGATPPPLDPRPGLWHYQGRKRVALASGSQGASPAVRNRP